MQICPFCQLDCAELKLLEGRCPRCGGIVQWSDEASAEASSITPPASTEPNRNQFDDMLKLDESETIVFPPDWNKPLAKSFQPAEESSESAPRAEPVDAASPGKPEPELTPNSRSSVENVEALWRQSIPVVSNRMATLKGPAQHETVTDTVFSVQPREIRTPGATDVEGRPVDYELLQIIGQGGVGVVYSGRQASIDRSVAIKMLRDEYRNRQDHRDKFLAEAVLTGELDHPNIVPIYDLGRSTGGDLFYSMKNVVGTPWDRVIGTKSLRENLDILLKVADAVAFAHSRGVVHRDLKPENVMLGSFGEVLVMDWGIALPTAEFRKSASILRSQAMGGTPAYMAPEMASGPVEKITTAADIYLLGALLFEILTGQPPHYGNDVMQCVLNASQNVIVETNVTGELMEIAIKSMSTLPRKRYRTVQDFQAAIRLYLSHSDSITLSDNAELELAKAIEQKNYQSFSRATFAFEEALAMWAENTPALDGIKRSTLAHAQAAMEKGDIDLGLSLLDENNPDHRSLVEKLRTAQTERSARQSRLKLFKRIAIWLSIFIFTAGSIGMAVILHLFQDASRLNASLKLAVDAAETARDNAVTQERIAKENSDFALQQEKIAVQQRSAAEDARRIAEQARLDSVAQKQKAEESSYFAEASLVGASLDQNGFTIAADVLDRQARSEAKSKLRHWEWGRHRYLVTGGHEDANPPVVSMQPLETSVESLDCSADGRWVAVGLTNGGCQLWQPGDAQPRFTIQHGRLLRDLDIDNSGRYLVTCGMEDEQLGSIKVWEIHDDQPPKLVKTLKPDRVIYNSVVFSNDPAATLLVVGDDHRMAHVWNWREGNRQSSMFGHMDQVSSVKFSPDNQYVGTACLDSNVRIFRTDSGEEVQRFSGHRAPVLCLAFTPNGKQVASAGAEQDIYVWDFDPTHGRAQLLEDVRRQVRGDQLPPPKYAAYKGHSGAINDLRFSNDGSLMISGSSDNTLCVWPVPQADYGNQSPMRLTALRKQSLDSLLTNRFQIEEPPRGNESASETLKPLVRLRGHGGWVRSCSFSADGQRVYSGSVDRSWRSWNFARYQEQKILGDRRVSVTDAHYSPDGRVAALAYDDGIIELWNTESGKLLGSLGEGHEYLTNRAQFVQQGARLITAAGDNTLRMWDTRQGSQLAVVLHAGRASAFAISGDEVWLAASGDDEGIYLAELSAINIGRRIRSRQQVEGEGGVFAEPTAVALSHDGHWLFVGTKSGRCEIWDAQRGELKHQLRAHGDTVVATFCLPVDAANKDAGNTVLSASADGTVAFWNLMSGQEIRPNRLRHQAAITSASLSSDGRMLVTSATLDRGKARVWLWNLSTSQTIATRDLQGQFVQDVSIASNNSVLVTTSNLESSAKEIWRWTATTDQWQPVMNRSLGSSTWGAITSPDGSELLSFGGKGAKLSRLVDGSELMQYRPSSSVYCLDFSPDNQTLAAGNEDGSITLWNINTQKSIRKLLGGHKNSVNDLDFSRDGQILVSCSAEGRIAKWDVTGNREFEGGRIARSGVGGASIRFSPDGQQVAIACDDQRVRIHDAQDLSFQFDFTGHADSVTCVTWSPDGRWLASGSLDKTIRLWSMKKRVEVSKLIGHLAPIHSVDFSSDGLRLVSSSQDSSVKLWDMDHLESVTLAEGSNQAALDSDTGEVLSLNYHTGPTTSAEFSPSGLDILSSGNDGVAIIWPAQRVPPALRLSRPSLTYESPEPVAMDPLACIMQVGSTDLDGGQVIVRPLPSSQGIQTATDDEVLAIDQSDGLFTIENERIQARGFGGQLIEVGNLKQPTSNQLEITLNAQPHNMLVQSLIRRITYQRIASTKESQPIDRKFEFILRDHLGQSGNVVPEVLVVR